MSSLTPIKIPGKRHRKSAAGDEPTKKRKPGRPRKDEMKQTGAVVTKRTRLQHRSLQEMKSDRQMSTIEKLPTEVLENIFLRSMNLNLPRSSPVLAGRLSSHYIYTRTIINVLGDSWNLPFRHEIYDTNFDRKQAAKDQTSLFKCRWMTVPLLREARKRWLVKNFSSYTDGEIAFSYREHKGRFLCSHPEYMEKCNESTHWPDTLEATLDIDEYLFSHPYSLAVAEARPLDDNGQPQLCRGVWVQQHFSQDLSDSAFPPERVLKGPWTQEKLFYLFWLASKGPSLMFADSTILPEVASQGLKDAIQEGNLQAIAFLQLAGLRHLAHEEIFEALATTSASDKAILIVRVLDLFLCGSHKSSPEGTWDHWVEDIIKLSTRDKRGSERNNLVAALKTQVYNYARTAYQNTEQFWVEDDGHTEQVRAILSRLT